MKTKNRTLAMLAAPAAMPPKPKTAAHMAIIKNTQAYQSISRKTSSQHSAMLVPRFVQNVSFSEQRVSICCEQIWSIVSGPIARMASS